MTQTARTRTDARYRGVIYGIDILDHETRQVMPNDYVGKTRQRGRARENQHRDDQPWSDLIVGSSHVLWEGICTEDELDEMERRFIQDVAVRPRMNWKLNEDNPQQIPKWVQVDQRHQRDEAAGRPWWVPVEHREVVSLLDLPAGVRSVPAVTVRRVSATRSWSALKVNTCIWSGSWGLITVVMWGLSGRTGLFATWTGNALFGCLVSLALCLWGLAGAPITRRQRRRSWKALKGMLPEWMR